MIKEKSVFLHPYLFLLILQFQVEDLGIGGSYDSNIDHNKSSSILSHSEIKDVQPTAASFLIHLTSSEAGGATIFPNLGITIWPKRGNAIFW